MLFTRSGLRGSDGTMDEVFEFDSMRDASIRLALMVSTKIAEGFVLSPMDVVVKTEEIDMVVESEVRPIWDDIYFIHLYML